MNIYAGKKGPAQAGEDFLLRTVVVFNQADKFTKTKKSKTYSDAKILRNWQRQFSDEFNIDAPSGEFYSKRTPYYKDLKDALWFGNEKDMIKSFFSAYNYVVTDLERQPGKKTASKRHKDALSAIKSSLRSMNPIRLSSQDGKGVIMSKKKQFLRWVEDKFGKDGYNKAIKSEKDYEYLMRKLDKLLNDKNLWLKHSVYYDRFKN